MNILIEADMAVMFLHRHKQKIPSNIQYFFLFQNLFQNQIFSRLNFDEFQKSETF